MQHHAEGGCETYEERKAPLVEAALDYYRSGWHIIGTHRVRPCLKSWLLLALPKTTCKPHDIVLAHYYNRSEAALKRYFHRRNIGGIAAVTGQHSNLVALDADGAEGIAQIEKLNLPPTRIVISPHGRHYYFQYPPGQYIGSCNQVIKGVDLRGEGGYVLLPPSRNALGAAYYWEDQNTPIAPLPEELLTIISQKRFFTKAERYVHMAKRHYYNYPLHRLLDILFNFHPK